MSARTVESLNPYATPYLDEAEKGIISCLLHSPDRLIPDAKICIDPELFYHPINRLVFTSVLDAHGKMPIDSVGLYLYFKNSGSIDKIGGPGALTELFHFVPTSAHYSYYFGVLQDLWRARATLKLADDLKMRVYEAINGIGEEGKDPIQEVQKLGISDLMKLHEVGLGGTNIRPGVTLKQAQAQWMEKYMAGTVSGRRFKHDWMNRILGGHIPGNAIVIAGPRGGGKSALAFEDAVHMAEMGARTSYFSLEQTAVQMFQRHCCMRGVNSNAFMAQQFTKEEMEIITDTRAHALDIPLVIHDDQTQFDRIISMIQMERHRDGLEYAIIDGPARVRGFRAESREQQLSGIVWGFKEQAKALGITTAMLCHLNQEGVTRGSEDIENHIDQLLLVVPSKKQEKTLLDPPGRKTLLRVNKNRDGKDKVGCLFRFIGEHFLFEEDMETDIELETRSERRG